MESELNERSLLALSALVLGAVLSQSAVAAPGQDASDSETTLPSVTTTLPSAVRTQLEGYIELRPSWVPNDSAVRFENNAYLGTRFSNGWLLAYRQEFLNELTGGEGRGVVLGDGWIEYSAYPALQKGRFTLNTEFHGILPVAEGSDDRNFILGARTYMEGIVQVAGRFGVFSRLMPRANIFKSGEAAGDRLRFENQFEVGPYVTLLSDRLTVRALVRWTAGLLEDADAPARWEQQLQLTPEILFQLTPEVVLGLAECSGSMVDQQFGGKAESLSVAFNESVWQFIVQVTL